MDPPGSFAPKLPFRLALGALAVVPPLSNPGSATAGGDVLGDIHTVETVTSAASERVFSTGGRLLEMRTHY